MLSRLADGLHKAFVLTAFSGTLFLVYTTMNQANFLVTRRRKLEAELAESGGEVVAAVTDAPRDEIDPTTTARSGRRRVV